MPRPQRRKPDQQPQPQPLRPTSILSEADAEAALAELGQIARIEQFAQQKRDVIVSAANKRCEERMTIEVDGTRINCTDRRKFLADELEAWAWNNKATLFAEPKSRELTSGRLGFRESKPTVDEIEATGEEKKSTWALLRDKLKTVLLKTLERARMGAGRAAGPVFNIAITPNKPALLQAFKSKKLTAKQLARLGFKHRPATDAFFLELEAKEITAPAAAEPPAAA